MTCGEMDLLECGKIILRTRIPTQGLGKENEQQEMVQYVTNAS